MDEETSRRHIAMTCHTDNAEAEKAYQPFISGEEERRLYGEIVAARDAYFQTQEKLLKLSRADEGVGNETRAWLDHLVTGAPTVHATPQQARVTLETTIAIERAVASGQPVRLPLQSEF